MGNNKKQFLYVLKPIPRLRVEENWTEADEKAVERHFYELQNRLKAGKLILAGKTGGLDEKTIGLVIFEADSGEEALEMMNNDPAVKEGVMTAELFPYSVALMRGMEEGE